MRGMKMVVILLSGAALLGCAAPRLPDARIHDVHLPDLNLPSINKLPLVYHIDVQQGNVVTQSMLSQLHKGMDKKKVQVVMGTPVVIDVFHPDRWDYIYTLSQNGGRAEYRRVTLLFENDRLKQIRGDVKAASAPLVVEQRQDLEVDVPQREARTLVDKLSSIHFRDPKKKKPAQSPGALETVEGTVATADQKEGAKASTPSSGEEILVPKGRAEDQRGFFKRVLEKVGIGRAEKERDYDPGKVKYRDPSRPAD